MASVPDIHTYYNQLADTYDENRFGNSYGQYMHKQETYFLEKLIHSNRKVLDLGCGTGRHLEFATHGLDFSERMIEEAKKKFPDKIFTVASAFDTGYGAESFDEAYSFHVFMHLSEEEIAKTLNEVARILKPGGQFIFDIPSAKRRKLVGYKNMGWHGSTSLNVGDILKLCGSEFKIKQTKGILMFPIHRLPGILKKILLPLDQLLCRSPLKGYASYILVVLGRE